MREGSREGGYHSGPRCELYKPLPLTLQLQEVKRVGNTDEASVFPGSWDLGTKCLSCSHRNGWTSVRVLTAIFCITWEMCWTFQSLFCKTGIIIPICRNAVSITRDHFYKMFISSIPGTLVPNERHLAINCEEDGLPRITPAELCNGLSNAQVTAMTLFSQDHQCNLSVKSHLGNVFFLVL